MRRQLSPSGRTIGRVLSLGPSQAEVSDFPPRPSQGLSGCFGGAVGQVQQLVGITGSMSGVFGAGALAGEPPFQEPAVAFSAAFQGLCRSYIPLLGEARAVRPVFGGAAEEQG